MKDKKFFVYFSYFDLLFTHFCCLIVLRRNVKFLVFQLFNILLLPPHLHLQQSRLRPLRNPSQGQPDLHEPLRIHLLPYLLRRTSGRKLSWRT